VASLNRPGGNVTGVVTMNSELGTKRLGLLQELLPTATRLAVLINPKPQRLAEAVTADVRAGLRDWPASRGPGNQYQP
jgi:putative ABC transport system substrate-binding protein